MSDHVGDGEEWRVRYAGFQGDLTPLRAATESCTAAFRAVRRAAENDELPLESEELRSHEAALAGAPDADEEPVAALADAVTERRQLLRERSPAIDAIASLLPENPGGDVAVITATDRQAETVVDGLGVELEGAFSDRVTHLDPDATGAESGIADALDPSGPPGIMVASLSALPSEGRLSPSTLVFVGSIEAVPTPDGVVGLLDDDVRSCRVRFAVGSPHTVETRLPSEDGQALLETAAQLRAAAHRAGSAIRFTARSTAVTDAVAQLETEGAALVRDLEAAGLDDRDASPAEATCLRDLLDGITSAGSTADLLGRWEPLDDDGPSTDGSTDQAEEGDEGVDRDDGTPESTGEPAGVRDRVREWLPFGGGSESGTAAPCRAGAGGSKGTVSTGTVPTRRAGDARMRLDPEERSRLLAQDPYRTRVGTARRFWRSYVDESFENDPIGLARALGRDLPASVAARLDAGLWREVLRLELVDLADAIGEPPSPHDMQRYGAFPPYEYVRRFGTWSDALAHAGLDVEEAGTDDASADVTVASLPFDDGEREAALLESLRGLAGALGTAPAPVDVQKFGEYPPHLFVDVFGSWRDALAAADIQAEPAATPHPDPGTGIRGPEPLEPTSDSAPEGALVAELGQLAAIIGGPPTREDVKKFGEYPPHRYVEVFGSWDAALERTGFTANAQGEEPDGVTDRVLGAVRALTDR